MRLSLLPPLTLALVTSCGPSPGTTSATTGGEPTDSAGGSASTSGTTGMSDGTSTSGVGTLTGSTGTSVTTTGPTTATDGTTTDPGTGSSTGGDPCRQPDPEPVEAAWTLTFEGGAPEQVLAGCTVASATEQPPQWVTVFDCTIDDLAQSVELAYTRSPFPGPSFFVGQEVVLEYRSEPIFWINQWFSIRETFDPNWIVLAGVSADKLVPPGTTAEAFYSVPLTVEGGLCAPHDVACGPFERLALAVPWLDVTILVYDRQFGVNANLPGSYSVWLANAERPLDPNQCDDLPPGWFQALMSLSIGP